MNTKSASAFFRAQKPVAPPDIPLDGSIDYVVATLGFMLVIGWLPSDASPKTLWIQIDGAKPFALHPKFSRLERPDVTAQLQKQNRAAPHKAGFVCAIRLPSALLNQFQDVVDEARSIKVGMEYGIGVGSERFHSISVMRGADAIGQGVLTAPILDLAIESLALPATDPAIRVLSSVRSHPKVKAHIDSAVTYNRETALVVGWLENAGRGTIVCVPSDLSSSPTFVDPVITPRDDVSAHLRDTDQAPETNLHGFVVVLNIKKSKRYRICHLKNGEEKWTSDFEVLPRQETITVAIEHVRRFTAESISSGVEGFRRFSRMMVGAKTAAPPDVAHVKTFFDAGRAKCPIETSIIIPFYGDGFYLIDHIMAQSRVPAGTEWIFVCDDPRLASGLNEALSNRRHLLEQPTKLLLLSNNGGYAHANNIGAKFSQGKHLLLMNSDVFCDDFEFLGVAAKTLDEQPAVGCVGFSLQFEDGTIQHDGMKFQRSATLDGLWVCEHPNKGMPQNWKKFDVERVDAVTAALVLLRKSEFPNGIIFDPTYIIGDFEDADLCLRLRNEGREIALIRSPGIFHLERQSMKLVGGSDARMAVTHLNCLSFNDRWGSWLSDANAKGEASNEFADH
jgi:GT2 family glycosyltransferase